MVAVRGHGPPMESTSVAPREGGAGSNPARSKIPFGFLREGVPEDCRAVDLGRLPTKRKPRTVSHKVEPAGSSDPGTWL